MKQITNGVKNKMMAFSRNFGKTLLISLAAFALVFNVTAAPNAGVRIKDLVRVKGVRDNALVGYGIVVGLAGTGDTSRTRSTYQAIANTLTSFGMTVSENDIQSRNVASVMITSNLPAFSEIGDTIDVHVSSMGDAKSLVGGTLLLAPLNGPNGNTYGIAQGQLSVGGYKFDAFGNVMQKNHPTVGIISKGATVEKQTTTHFFKNGNLNLILNEPDFTTANRIVERLSKSVPNVDVEALSAGKIKIHPKSEITNNELTQLISIVENLPIIPDLRARVVVNERTGTVVSGGNVRVSAITISHGNLKLKIDTQYAVSQPNLLVRPSQNISTEIVPETNITVDEGKANSVSLSNGTSVAELIDALKAVNLTTRDMITILQSIKQAGALHAELIIQ